MTMTASEKLNEVLELKADEVAALAGEAGLVGSKLPGGYVVIQVSPCEYLLTVKGKRLVRELVSNDDFMAFHKEVGRGLVEKINRDAKEKAKEIEKAANAIFGTLAGTI